MHHLALIVAHEDIVDSPDLTRVGIICGNYLVLLIILSKSLPNLPYNLPFLVRYFHCMKLFLG